MDRKTLTNADIEELIAATDQWGAAEFAAAADYATDEVGATVQLMAVEGSLARAIAGDPLKPADIAVVEFALNRDLGWT